MKSHAKVVVIGGGVVGAAVLYHLTKFGWKDVLLIERSELTSGSTWHAAGGFHNINSDTNMAALQSYTIGIYKELEEITGMSCGLHHSGALVLATTAERMDYLRTEQARHRYMGLKTEILSPKEISDYTDIINIEGVLGALYDPLDGHLDPSGTTQAYAKAARIGGAEISLRNPVIELNPQKDGSWEVVCKEGTVIAEHVVNAAGLWAREVGEMAGVYLPLHPMEHQYLVTDNIPEIEASEKEVPHAFDPAGESYLRQEGLGLVIGFYEQGATPWAVGGTPKDFGHELLPDNLERIGDSLEMAYHRFPVLEKAGIKRIINGPFTFAPDGNPLVGPVPGLRNYWSACAVMAGFSQGGGVALTLAEWMIEGEPSRDVFGLDVSRFGDWITPSYTLEKVTEFYQRRFSVSFPNEELPAARPHQQSPMYSEWKARRAVFGADYGMESVNYFALEGDPLVETPSFRRSNAFEAVGQECRAVRTAVGIGEIHNFAKLKVTGSGARDWLDRMMAGFIPKPGRVALNPLLSPKGRLIGDFTVSCLNDNSFQLTSSFGLQANHRRWFDDHLPKDGSVHLENVSSTLLGFQIAGPKAKELLRRVVFQKEEVDEFRFLSLKWLDIGTHRALVQRLSYTGDLGFEIFVPASEQVALFHILMEAGEDLGLRPFGLRALLSLRLEKPFGAWSHEFRPDYGPDETGLGRFVRPNKSADFIGKEALQAAREKGLERKLSCFVVEDSKEPGTMGDVAGDEPISIDGKLVGFVTSGGYAHFADKSVALGFVPVESTNDGQKVEIEILGEARPATLITRSLFDPDHTRMRG